MGRFKHPHKGVVIDRTTEDIAAPVPQEIKKNYKDIHLDIDTLFVNKTPFLLAISRDIGFIHCKAMVSNHSKRVQNRLKPIAVNYQSRGFKVVTAFGDGAFKHLIKWAQSDLHMYLITCAAASHVPRANNAIRFIKERFRSIQSEHRLKIPKEAYF